MWLDVSLKKDGTMIFIFLDCNIFSCLLPECYTFQCVIIQNSDSVSFFHHTLRTQFQVILSLLFVLKNILFFEMEGSLCD